MSWRLIYGCGGCERGFVIPHVCVYGTYSWFFMFFFLSYLYTNRTTWSDRIYLDVCFFQHNVWWSVITRNVKWSPEAKGPFLSHCLAFMSSVSQWICSALCMVIWCLQTQQSVVFGLFLTVWRIWICPLEKRSAARDKWVKPERQRFTSHTCISLQMPRQRLTLSPGCTIVCWRTLQSCSEYLHARLQVGPARLFPRNRQKRAGLLAFPCLWKIERAVVGGTSAWFTPPPFIPLQNPPQKSGGPLAINRREVVSGSQSD